MKSDKHPTRPATPGQKTFRAPAELLQRLDERAMMETAILGVDVGASDIIRRGLDWAMAQPLPGVTRRPCNVVTTAAKGRLCITCGTDVLFDATRVCPQDGEALPK